MTPENLKTTREISERSMVLLKNDKQILPLKKTGTIVVIGPLANSKVDIIGNWASCANMDSVSTILEGIKNIGGNTVNVQYASIRASSGRTGQQNAKEPPEAASEQLSDEALQTVKNADVIIAVLGELSASSGEADIGLQKNQQNLLKAFLATGTPVVLVLVNSHPLMLSWEYKNVSAILEAWTGGTEAGNAVATVLFGDYNPSGKLTFTIPLNIDQIPVNYNQKKIGRPMDPHNKVASKYPDSSGEPLFPFGYGLSYTTFSYSDIRLSKTQLTGNEKLIASITLTNTGRLAGEEVVQLYIQDPVASISRPVKELKNFKKVLLKPGEKKEVSFEITKNDLMFYNSDLKYDWESGDFIIYIGTNSKNVKSARVNWEK
jgi:beta-glucosidase